MDNQTTLYCELMTKEQVVEFEKLLMACGCSPYERPMHYARMPTAWMAEGRERKEGEDPMAAVTLDIYHDTKQVWLDSGYRSCSGEKITPEMMKNFIRVLQYVNQKQESIQPSAQHGQEHSV